MKEKLSPPREHHLTQDDRTTVEFMLKKLEIESNRQNNITSLAEQVLNWYVAVLVLVSSGVGLVWITVSQSQVSLLIVALATIGLGIFGVLISMRILRFMTVFDLKQKVIDAIELFFVKENPDLRMYLLKTADWPLTYRALNPWTAIYYLTFTLLNAALVSIGIGLVGYWVTRAIAMSRGHVVLGNEIIWAICTILLTASTFIVLQTVRRRTVREVERAYQKELEYLKVNVLTNSENPNLG